MRPNRIWGFFVFFLLLTTSRAQAQDCSFGRDSGWDVSRLQRCLTGDPSTWSSPGERTLLHHAAATADNPQVISLIIRDGFNVNAVDDRGRTPVHSAAASSPGVLSALLEAGANPDSRDNSQWTPMHVAAWEGDSPTMTMMLLYAGADPNARTSRGRTPLHYGAQNYRASDSDASVASSMVVSLLRAGSDPNAADEDGVRPIHVAASSGRADVVAALVNGGADAKARSSNGDTPIHRAVLRSSQPVARAVVSALLDWGAGAILAPLQLAALRDDSAGVVSLLAQGADADEADHIGWTPLHFATINNGPRTIAVLLDSGANPNAQSSRGRTPLHFGTLRDSAAVAAFLQAATDLNALDDGGRTPLIAYVNASGSAEVVIRELLRAGADPNVTDGNGWTALLFAAIGGSVAGISALLDAGADAGALSANGQTPLTHYLGSLGLPESGPEGTVVNALLRAGADPNVGRSYGGESALHLAAEHATDPAVVLMLLEAGANPLARDERDRLPIDVAEENEAINGTDAYWLLRSRGRRR